MIVSSYPSLSTPKLFMGAVAVFLHSVFLYNSIQWQVRQSAAQTINKVVNIFRIFSVKSWHHSPWFCVWERDKWSWQWIQNVFHWSFAFFGLVWKHIDPCVLPCLSHLRSYMCGWELNVGQTGFSCSAQHTVLMQPLERALSIFTHWYPHIHTQRRFHNEEHTGRCPTYIFLYMHICSLTSSKRCEAEGDWRAIFYSLDSWKLCFTGVHS